MPKSFGGLTLEQAHFFSAQLRTVDRLEQMETWEVIYAGAIKLEGYNEPDEGKWPVGYSAKVRGFFCSEAGWTLDYPPH